MDPSTPTVFDHLDREWEHLLTGRSLDRALLRWRDVERPLRDFRRVRDLLKLLEDREVAPERQSQVLLALLRLARSDALAARLLLQRFVPALKSIAGWGQPLPQADWAAMVVSAAHEVIVTYPVERRPERVAGNVVWDVRKRMYAALSEHRRWVGELSLGELGDDAHVVADVTAGCDAADLLGWAASRSRVPRDVARLIQLTRGAGFQIEELAAARSVPSARLRQQRWRCEQRMREAIAAC